MNIKKLEELDVKSSKLRHDLEADIASLGLQIENLNRAHIRSEMDGDTASSNHVFDELIRLEKTREAKVGALSEIKKCHNPYYSDTDVYEGFKEFSEVYERQFAKAKKEYLDIAARLFEAYKKCVSLRASALEVRERYINHLSDPPVLPSDVSLKLPLSTLIRGKNNTPESIDFRSFYSNMKEAGEDNAVLYK